MARSTTRTMSRLTPGQASSISEIENGKPALEDFRAHPVALGTAPALDVADTVLELLVRAQQGTPEVTQPRGGVVNAFMPPL
jgi:hypothetical protein